MHKGFLPHAPVHKNLYFVLVCCNFSGGWRGQKVFASEHIHGLPQERINSTGIGQAYRQDYL